MTMEAAGCPDTCEFKQTDFGPCSCNWVSSIQPSEANGCTNRGGPDGQIGDNAPDWDCTMAPGYDEEGTCSGRASVLPFPNPSTSTPKTESQPPKPYTLKQNVKPPHWSDNPDPETWNEDPCSSASSGRTFQSQYALFMLGWLACSFYRWSRPNVTS